MQTGVVGQPLLQWQLVGRRPKPFLASNFWLFVGADSPTREVIFYLMQSLSQYTATVIVVSYTTFFASLAIYTSYQAEVCCRGFEYQLTRLLL